MQITARKFTSLFLLRRSRNEFFEVSNAAFHSNNQWCSSCSAAVSSDSFTSQQRQKRVSKQQRTAMVLAFVEKFRALNSGKFPSVSYTKKQIGGSYYVTRSIIQQLEYNYKRSLETKKEVKIKEENTKCEAFLLTEQPCISADAKQTFFNEYVDEDTEIRKEHSRNKSKDETKASRLSIKTNSGNQIEINVHRELTPPRVSKESQEDKCLGFDNSHASSPLARTTVEPQTHTSVISDAEALHVESRVPSKLEMEKNISCTPHEEREVSEKEVASAANLQDACCPEGKKMSNEKAFRSEELDLVKREKVEQGAATTTKSSSFWIHLKSMAVDIVNLWKK